jgi:hypothetical protein
MLIRQLHAYLSAFVAPTILFFAVTGSFQLFSLHQAHGNYRPPALLEKLGRVHTDQQFALKPKHNPGPAPKTPVAKTEGDWVAPAAKPAADADDAPSPREMALKWLFLVAAITLVVSTVLGLWMAVIQNRRKGILLLLLLAGMAAPLAIFSLL